MKKSPHRLDFDELINSMAVTSTTTSPTEPAVSGTTIKLDDLKPSVDVYRIATRFLSRFNETNAADAERLEKLCRYLIASLASENPKTSYIGVALNKEFSHPWIRHVKQLLYLCCECMRALKPENHSDSLSLALYLHTLVAFTSPNTWALLRCKSLTALRPGMAQLCSNIMGGLVQKGFFQSLRVRHFGAGKMDQFNMSFVLSSHTGGFVKRHMPNACYPQTDFDDCSVDAQHSYVGIGKFH